MREFYCKTIAKGQVKDAFSVKTCYTPDAPIDRQKVEELYMLSRAKYNRTLAEVKEEVDTTQDDVLATIDDFSSPLI
jgi:hypothetical protein